MIQSAFNSLISSNTLLLEEAKTKARDAVDPKFKAKILEKLPSPENIKSQLSDEIATTDDLALIEAKYLNLKNKCQSLISQVDNKIKQLEGIKAKTNGISDNFSKLDEVIDIGNTFIPILKIIITAAPTLLASLSGMFANGLATVKIDDGLKGAKSKIVEFDAVLKSLSTIQPFIIKQSTTLSTQIDPAINILRGVKTQIEFNCNYIDTLFLQLIAQFSGLLDQSTETTKPKPQFNNPGEILANLENSNKEKFFQYIKDMEGNTGYKIIKK